MESNSELLNARYDNADMAFALGVTNFPEWRKNTERNTLMALPRIDENQARPTFRIGHIYEYALRLELGKHMNRDGASAFVVALFEEMRGNACRRFNKLDSETNTAIAFDGLLERYMEESSVKAPADNYWFVEYPALAFDPLFLDRSPERLAAPLLWVLPPAEAGRHAGCPMVIGPTVDTVEMAKRMTDALRSVQIDPNAVEPVRSVTVLDLTTLLNEIDRRLSIRLHSRRLRGQA